MMVGPNANTANHGQQSQDRKITVRTVRNKGWEQNKKNELFA
jgi:hypothetical protein